MAEIPKAALAAVGREELAKAATLFGAVKALRLRLATTAALDESSLDHSFQVHTTSVLDRLEQRLLLLGEQNPLRKVETIMAKHGLYDAAFQQVIALNSNVSPILGESLKELRTAHLGFLADFQSCVGDFLATINTQRKESAVERNATNVLKDECTQLLESVRLLDGEADKHQAEILDLRRKVRLLEQANAELESDLKTTRRGAPHGGGNSNSSSSSSSPSRMDTYLAPSNKFLRGGRASAAFSPSRTQPPLPPPPSASYSISSSSAAAQQPKARPQSPPPKQQNPSSFSSSSSLPQQLQMEWFYNFRVELQAVLDSGKCRLLSLAECKDLIDKLFLDKTMAERRTKVCETMENWVYRFMEKKYGLRSLAVEHTGNLMRSLDHYSSTDNEVAVFFKIFRNEVEEDYRFVSQELNKSIKELLFEQISKLFPTKDRSFLQEKLDKTLAGSVTETQWNDIIRYLYNGADSAAINVVLKRQARDELTAKAARSSSNESSAIDEYRGSTFTRTKAKTPPAPLEILTGTFIKTVLDFQLRAHEQFLLQFRQSFIASDGDHDGVLSREEFLSCFKLIRRADRGVRNGQASSSSSAAAAAKFAKGPARVVVIRTPGEEEAASERRRRDEETTVQEDAEIFARLLAIVDPLGVKPSRITFSQAASGMSKLAAK